MRECWLACLGIDPAAVRWGETGPVLVTKVFAGRDMRRHALSPEVINPVDWWEAHRLPFMPMPQWPATTHAVHFWNEVWKHHGLDKDATFPRESAYEVLKARYAAVMDAAA
jgi:hypothetical protein